MRHIASMCALFFVLFVFLLTVQGGPPPPGTAPNHDNVDSSMSGSGHTARTVYAHERIAYDHLQQDVQHQYHYQEHQRTVEETDEEINPREARKYQGYRHYQPAYQPNDASHYGHQYAYENAHYQKARHDQADDGEKRKQREGFEYEPHNYEEEEAYAAPAHYAHHPGQERH